MSPKKKKSNVMSQAAEWCNQEAKQTRKSWLRRPPNSLCHLNREPGGACTYKKNKTKQSIYIQCRHVSTLCRLLTRLIINFQASLVASGHIYREKRWKHLWEARNVKTASRVSSPAHSKGVPNPHRHEKPHRGIDGVYYSMWLAAIALIAAVCAGC